MSTKPENLIPAQLSKVEETEAVPPAVAPEGKKAFVEPEVSFPIDVLEATTFFQSAESGFEGPVPEL